MPLPKAVRRLTPDRLRDDPRLRGFAVGAGVIPPRALHSTDEAAAIARLARGRRRVVEIGVYEGASAAVLCRALPDDADLHLIDPFVDASGWALPPGWGATEWATRRVVARAQRRAAGGGPGAGCGSAGGRGPGAGGDAPGAGSGGPGAGGSDPGAGCGSPGAGGNRDGHDRSRTGYRVPRVHWHIAPSAEVGASWTGPVDLVFIDGDHNEEACRTDWEQWHRHVVPGGVVAFHDARRSQPGGDGAPGPTAVVDALFRGADGSRNGNGPAVAGWTIVDETHRLVAVRRDG